MTHEGGAIDAAPPAAEDAATLRFTATPSKSDIMSNAVALGRRSGALLAVGTFITATAAVGLAVSDRMSVGFLLPDLLLLLFGLSMLSGLFVVPFIWWAIRQRGDLILAPLLIEADADGITLSTSQATSRQHWSVYRRARETPRAFLLDIGTGAVVMITKQGVTETEVASFRDLLDGAKLLDQPPSLRRRLRPLLWIAVGLAAAGAVIMGPRLIGSVGATATMDVGTSVASGFVTISGTSDLPDGSTVWVEALQLDEWEQASADGIQPDGAQSWERYGMAIVQDGAFSSTLSLAEWPSGRGLAVAYFWMDPGQPDGALDRFGFDGSGLRGPDVTDDQTYGPMLKVQQPFEIP